MKQIFFLFFLLLSAGLVAQKVETAPPASAALKPADEAAARAATEALVLKYAFNADQAKQMYTIQVRKLRNLAAIESIKASDPARYRAKLKSVYSGALASTRRILQTKAQVAIFDQTKVDIRQRQAEKRKEMMVAGASKDAIEMAMLEIHAE